MDISLDLSGFSVAISADDIQQKEEGWILKGQQVNLRPSSPPLKFYRHGWHSWSLTCWLDPARSPRPIRAPGLRDKDEDPLYALSTNHVGAWVGAHELPGDQFVLLGALNLGARVAMDGISLHGFYEAGYVENEWFLVHGSEEQVFSRYVQALAGITGQGFVDEPPRVWCSWYSLYNWINEPLLHKVLDQLGDLPFDVFQVDAGWQIAYGDWEANRKFPAGMNGLASRIAATGRKPGLWLAPLMVARNSSLFRDHPDWILQDEDGQPVKAGITWGGSPFALDTSHPGVLDWLDSLIRKVRSWGYEYLKLDFLYTGALPGRHYRPIPREIAYRDALGVMHQAAGDAYLLACGAPILPSLGLCDGIRVGPDVAPYWLNTPMSVWLDNPAHPGTRNSIRNSLGRLWLKPLVNVDPDVAFFRSRHNALTSHQKDLQTMLGWITGFKSTSDLPGWLEPSERNSLKKFLETHPTIKQLDRNRFLVGEQLVEYDIRLPLAGPVHIPPGLAMFFGLYDMLRYEILPALWSGIKK